MFNRTKKFAKRFTWHYLRIAQRIALNSTIGADSRIDSRKLMVSLGAFGIYMSLKNDPDISTSQIDHFMNYVFERAPRDIHDLLAERRLEQLDPNCFKQCYSDLNRTYVNSETAGADAFTTTLICAIDYALKDEFRDNDNLKYILDNHMGEIKDIVSAILGKPRQVDEESIDDFKATSVAIEEEADEDYGAEDIKDYIDDDKYKFFKILSEDLAEPISDSELVDFIVDVNKAKDKYSAEDYTCFLQLLNKIASDKNEFLSNKRRLLDRSFAIAYRFWRNGFPFEDIYKGSPIFYRDYVIKKPDIDNLITEMGNSYYDIIDSVCKKSHLRRGDTHRCAAAFLSFSFETLLGVGDFDCSTDFLPSIYDNVEWYYSAIVDKHHGEDENAEQLWFERIKTEYTEMLDGYDSVEVDVCLKDFTKRFLKIIGADPNNEELFELLYDEIYEWGHMAYKEIKANEEEASAYDDMKEETEDEEFYEDDDNENDEDEEYDDVSGEYTYEESYIWLKNDGSLSDAFDIGFECTIDLSDDFDCTVSVNEEQYDGIWDYSDNEHIDISGFEDIDETIIRGFSDYLVKCSSNLLKVYENDRENEDNGIIHVFIRND